MKSDPDSDKEYKMVLGVNFEELLYSWLHLIILEVSRYNCIYHHKCNSILGIGRNYIPNHDVVVENRSTQSQKYFVAIDQYKYEIDIFTKIKLQISSRRG